MAQPIDVTLVVVGASIETTPLPESLVSGNGVRRFRLVIAEGPARGQAWQSSSDRCAIGSHSSNDVVLDDPTVSRFHCEVRVDQQGARVRDLDSRNGTLVDGIRVGEAWLRHGNLLRLGSALVQFQLGAETVPLLLSARNEFGPLVGRSAAMRACFALLERAAQSDATVLIEGETGTGKEGAAEAIHQASAYRDRPLVVVDCGAVPAGVLESELFGHERGSFTGAVAARTGAFEEAAGGTVFLDEIGELPLDLQPKLLRVLERKEIKRVGSSTYKTVEFRIVAATHRDLRAQVNSGDFRSDLYYRLAVMRVSLPPLRARSEDLPLLVERLLQVLEATPEQVVALRRPDFLEKLARGAWPGNVRELRNYLERCLVMEQSLPLEEGQAPDDDPPDLTAPYPEARRRVIERFERSYVEALMARNQGKVVQAAQEAGIDRVSLYRLLRRHGLRGRM